MTDAPAPLTTPDIDLDGMPGFMLDTEKLRQSELWALSTGEEFKAAVGLWCRAWVQKPAGSLPNDERLLAAWSGAGKRWAKVRDMAMRGFILCSDGRLYHPVLCADAHRAWGRRASYRERASNAAAARWGWQKQSSSNASRMLERAQGEGEGEGQGINTPPPPASAPSAPPASAPAMVRNVVDLQTVFPAFLVTRDDRERASVLLRLFGWDRCAKALQALATVAATRPPDRRRVFTGDLSDWLHRHYQPEPEDYARAGLPVPPSAD